MNLSLFKILPAVANHIEKVMRDFLWWGVGKKSKDHLVSWDVYCLLKEEGGLGTGRLVKKNTALLGK